MANESKKVLIYYSCVAAMSSIPSIRILTEYMNGDYGDNRDLASLAFQCLHCLPPFLDSFSYTANERILAVLFSEPFLFCAIAHEALSRSKIIAFLSEVRLEFLSRYSPLLLQDMANDSQLVDPRFHRDFLPVYVKLLFTVATSLRPGKEIEETSSSSLQPANVPASAVDYYEVMMKSEQIHPNTVKVKVVDDAIANSAEEGWSSKKRKIPIQSRSSLFFFWPPWKLLLQRESKVQSRGIEGWESESEASSSSESAAERISKQVGRSNGRCRRVKVILILDAVVCVLLFGMWMAICKGLSCTID